MSDVPLGEGWWRASDGKWYAPELYPADWPRPGGVVPDPASAPGWGAEEAGSAGSAGTGDPWTRPSGPPPVGHSIRAGADESPRRSPDLVAGVLGVAGAALLWVGSFLDWATVTGDDLSGAVNGLTGSNGWGTLTAGAVVLVGVAAALLGKRDWYVGAAVTVAALVALGLAGFSIFDMEDLSDDLPGLLVAEGVRPQTAATAGLDLAPGVWLVAGGGVISLIGGVAALARSR